jgi:hypothetical protein
MVKLSAEIPANYELDEDVQNTLLDVFASVHYIISQLGREKMHQNPNAPEGYSSSSFLANDNDFKPAQGGFGPPSDPGGSFYHHPSEDSFKFLHPDWDEEDYGSSTPPCASERCTPSKWLHANTHRFTQPPYTQTPSSPPDTPPHSSTGIPSIFIVDVDAVEQEKTKNTTSVAASGKPVQVKTEEKISQSATIETTVEIKSCAWDCTSESATTTTDSKVAEDGVANDDSGIALDDTMMSDSEDFNFDASQSKDSAYGTQPIKDTEDSLPEANDDIDSYSGSLSPPPNSSDLSDEGEALQSSEESRRKITRKSNAARNSARVASSATPTPTRMPAPAPASLSTPTPAPISASSLGKHAREADVDNNDNANIQEADPKRVKFTLP